MNKKILITGGFGYLGGRIAKTLADSGFWDVCISSRHARDKPDWLLNGEVVVLDLSRPEAFKKALNNVYAIIHLAAMNEAECVEDPEMALRINTIGTQSLLKAAIETGVERFIYFSTAHVYGMPLTGHITEKVVPRPIHPYAITHHAAEDFVLAAHDKGDITGLVFRLSNGYGAPAHAMINQWTLLVNDLCRQAVNNKTLKLRSHGLQMRDFVTLHDVARATSHFLELSGNKCADGLFNIGGSCSMSVLDMAKKVADCCEIKFEFKPAIKRPDTGIGVDVVDFSYDISKLKNTDFSLEGNIDKEIIDTLEMCASFNKYEGHH